MKKRELYITQRDLTQLQELLRAVVPCTTATVKIFPCWQRR